MKALINLSVIACMIVLIYVAIASAPEVLGKSSRGFLEKTLLDKGYTYQDVNVTIINKIEYSTLIPFISMYEVTLTDMSQINHKTNVSKYIFNSLADGDSIIVKAMVKGEDIVLIPDNF